MARARRAGESRPRDSGPARHRWAAPLLIARPERLTGIAPRRSAKWPKERAHGETVRRFASGCRGAGRGCYCLAGFIRRTQRAARRTSATAIRSHPAGTPTGTHGRVLATLVAALARAHVGSERDCPGSPDARCRTAGTIADRHGAAASKPPQQRGPSAEQENEEDPGDMGEYQGGKPKPSDSLLRRGKQPSSAPAAKRIGVRLAVPAIRDGK